MRNWGDAKRDWIKFRGKKIKVRNFVAMIAAALPKMVDDKTEEPIDHAAKLKEAYCMAGLAGMEKYETMILEIQRQHTAGSSHNAQELYGALSVRARKAISDYFGKNFDIEPMETITVLHGLNRERLAGMKNVGAGTLKEIDELMKFLKFDYGKESKG